MLLEVDADDVRQVEEHIVGNALPMDELGRRARVHVESSVRQERPNDVVLVTRLYTALDTQQPRTRMLMRTSRFHAGD